MEEAHHGINAAGRRQRDEPRTPQNKKGRSSDPVSGKEWSEVRRPSAMQVAQILDFLMCVELFLHDLTAVSGIPATNRN